MVGCVAATVLLEVQTSLGNIPLTNWAVDSNPCTDNWRGVTCAVGNSDIVGL